MRKSNEYLDQVSYY